jgi:ribosome-associated protein
LKISKKRVVLNSTVNVEQLMKDLTDFLENEKLFEIVTIPLKGKSQEADYMIVASGRSARQVVAVSEKLIQSLKSFYGILSRVEGLNSANWVLIDAGDIVVHIFKPEVRDYYQLERMWQVSTRIPTD